MMVIQRTFVGVHEERRETPSGARDQWITFRSPIGCSRVMIGKIDVLEDGRGSTVDRAIPTSRLLDGGDTETKAGQENRKFSPSPLNRLIDGRIQLTRFVANIGVECTQLHRADFSALTGDECSDLNMEQSSDFTRDDFSE
uniref:Uncharacterized protein n=1 Tax=Caenorhabditis tropicalis TaxID=1561998 RepID=A0A1I7U2W0_9PELO